MQEWKYYYHIYFLSETLTNEGTTNACPGTEAVYSHNKLACIICIHSFSIILPHEISSIGLYMWATVKKNAGRKNENLSIQNVGSSMWRRYRYEDKRRKKLSSYINSRCAIYQTSISYSTWFGKVSQRRTDKNTLLVGCKAVQEVRRWRCSLSLSRFHLAIKVLVDNTHCLSISVRSECSQIICRYACMHAFVPCWPHSCLKGRFNEICSYHYGTFRLYVVVQK